VRTISIYTTTGGPVASVCHSTNMQSVVIVALSSPGLEATEKERNRMIVKRGAESAVS